MHMLHHFSIIRGYFSILGERGLHSGKREITPGGTLGRCTCAQEAIGTKRRKKIWLASGL